jgi:hypothetical protein
MGKEDLSIYEIYLQAEVTRATETEFKRTAEWAFASGRQVNADRT